MNNFQLGFCFRRASCTVLPAVLIISSGGGGGGECTSCDIVVWETIY